MSAPLNLVNLERVHKAHGTTVILDDVSLGVAAGERIGVVGRNGGGKSTLLSMLTGADEPDSGRVTRRGDLAMGVLDQSGTLPAGTTVRDVVLPPSMFAAEHEWAGDAAVRSVLTGLELDRLGLDAPVAPMSGGERRRVALAAAADPPAGPAGARRADQPPRRRGRRLAGRVRAGRAPAALVVVTHDRWFLDEVCTTTWEVADGDVHAYDGGYSAYTLARAERARIAAVTEERRHEPGAQGAGLAAPRPAGPDQQAEVPDRGRAGADRRRAAGPGHDGAASGFAARRLGKTVYDVEDVDYAVPTGDGPRTLFERPDLAASARATGSASSASTAPGKTSLLKLLVGETKPDAGTVVVGQTVRAGLPVPARHRAAAERAGARGGAGRRPRSPGSATRRSPRRQLAERFGFAGATGSGRRSATSPAASGAGCSCCGC